MITERLGDGDRIILKLSKKSLEEWKRWEYAFLIEEIVYPKKTRKTRKRNSLNPSKKAIIFPK
ncbi:MAG: hypothetical protein WD512_06425 [Candidatus Paceibacterota bacterium]